MNKVERLIVLSCVFLMPHIVFGQFFEDLDFDSADVSSPDSLHRVLFADAFPGWWSSQSFAYYNASDIDQMTIGVYDFGHPVLGSSGYTAYLEADLGSFLFLSGSVGL